MIKQIVITLLIGWYFGNAGLTWYGGFLYTKRHKDELRKGVLIIVEIYGIFISLLWPVYRYIMPRISASYRDCYEEVIKEHEDEEL